MASAARSSSLLEEALDTAAEALDLHEIADAPLSKLQQAIGASGAFLYRYDVEGRLEGLGGTLEAAMADYRPDLWRTDPTQQEPHRLPPGRRVVLPVQMVGRDRFQRSEAYEAFYRPLELNDLLCVWLSDCAHGVPGMTGMLFTRPRDASFQRDELRRVRRALPVFAAAARRHARFRPIARRARGAGAVAEHARDGAFAAVDAGGALLWVGARAERYLARVDGELTLPRAVVTACRALGARSRDARVEVSFRDGAGDTVCAQLAWRREPEPVIVIAFTAQRVALGRRHGLTPAERRVLTGLADGSSNREIALTLHVSVETVRTHVRRILQKLGVSSRLEAALRVRDDP